MSRYPWPASGLALSDMKLLFHAREQTEPHTPITELIAQAVRQAYGQAQHSGTDLQPVTPLAEAA